MSEDIFENKYIAFAHGLRLSDKDNSSFVLNPNYRVVTLHIPGKNIREDLVKIILNQINNKINSINTLFTISCPIGRKSTKILLENNFIKDYLRYILNKYPEKINTEINNIFLDDTTISDLSELNTYLEKQDFEEIKQRLAFEIRTYRPGDLTPRLLLDFKIQKRLSIIPGGIYKPETFKDFEFDKKSDDILIDSLSDKKYSSEDTIKSIINFNLDNVYLFDDKDVIPESNNLSFFKTIETTIPHGLIVVLSCGKFDGKHTSLQRQNSTSRQTDTTYRKYYINYE